MAKKAAKASETKAAAKKPAKSKSTPKAKAAKPKAAKAPKTTKKPSGKGVPIYTLDVFIISGPVHDKFLRKNPVISRSIEMRGDQTLEELHEAIFEAFDRFDEHMYEFQFGERPMDPKAKRYVLEVAMDDDGGPKPKGTVEDTTLDSLKLKVGDCFGYWFDFGDDWWHQVDVMKIEDESPKGKYPKISNKVGKSPPQYLEDA